MLQELKDQLEELASVPTEFNAFFANGAGSATNAST